MSTCASSTEQNEHTKSHTKQTNKCTRSSTVATKPLITCRNKGREEERKRENVRGSCAPQKFLQVGSSAFIVLKTLAVVLKVIVLWTSQEAVNRNDNAVQPCNQWRLSADRAHLVFRWLAVSMTRCFNSSRQPVLYNLHCHSVPGTIIVIKISWNQSLRWRSNACLPFELWIWFVHTLVATIKSNLHPLVATVHQWKWSNCGKVGQMSTEIYGKIQKLCIAR